jgi:hypothetical protein
MPLTEVDILHYALLIGPKDVVDGNFIASPAASTLAMARASSSSSRALAGPMGRGIFEAGGKAAAALDAADIEPFFEPLG